MSSLLSVDNLTTHFFLDEGVLRAVDGVSFSLEEGETVGIVGESGCGKTIVAMSLLRLVQRPGRIIGGRVLYRGEDLLKADEPRLGAVRGGGIGLVFQEPGASLNPVIPVGRQLAEVLRRHRGLARHQAEREAVQLLGEVGITDPEQRTRSYAFQLSGGMQQRVAIALAISGRPRLLVADEPTTALDVTVQAEILDLLVHLQHQHRMAILLISHDIGVVAEIAHRVLVMYTGKIVEDGHTAELFRAPQHPYTRGLLGAMPRLDAPRNGPLTGIPGAVPDLLRLPEGCTFRFRCSLVGAECSSAFPPLAEITPGRRCACYKVASAQVMTRAY